MDTGFLMRKLIKSSIVYKHFQSVYVDLSLLIEEVLVGVHLHPKIDSVKFESPYEISNFISLLDIVISHDHWLELGTLQVRYIDPVLTELSYFSLMKLNPNSILAFYDDFRELFSPSDYEKIKYLIDNYEIVDPEILIDFSPDHLISEGLSNLYSQTNPPIKLDHSRIKQGLEVLPKYEKWLLESKLNKFNEVIKILDSFIYQTTNYKILYPTTDVDNVKENLEIQNSNSKRVAVNDIQNLDLFPRKTTREKHSKVWQSILQYFRRNREKYKDFDSFLKDLKRNEFLEFIKVELNIEYRVRTIRQIIREGKQRKI